MFARVLLVPSILDEEFLRLPMIPARDRPGPAGVLPLRLRGQAVSRAVEVVGSGLHPLCINWLAVLLDQRLVTWFEFFSLAQPVAILDRPVPGSGYLRPTYIGAGLDRVIEFLGHSSPK